ncbi:uncharacterized protein KY384_008396 [Bacidia gigantensis]|uniref:uncharacterized protein n=1 Tax=Bacidia gigantensis TaxID=2732470 RepID=UPI001D0387A8|nr:uncharacterized protein KY384_008396 [Bacidia gigantensis]KAG8526967.1 hypothetical protein KY384_008396 [Bacidia gigantensis]
MAPKIAIVFYSLYGHIKKLAEAEKEGIESAGGKVDLYQPFFWAFQPVTAIFRAQWKTFWDATGQLWASGGLWGKYAGTFLSTASLGGGQESTALATMSTLAHHGIIYVPFGYAKAFAELTATDQLRGGGPWGAGTVAGPSGERQPSDRELFLAKEHGKSFYEVVSKVNF